MEGYLHNKARGDGGGIFSRRNWSKRWMVLEGQYLTYYEQFDQKADSVGKKKGVVPVKGVELRTVTHKNRQHCFVVRHPDRRPVYLSANSENEKFAWLEAIEKASEMKERAADGKIDLTEYWICLSLDPVKALEVSVWVG